MKTINKFIIEKLKITKNKLNSTKIHDVIDICDTIINHAKNNNDFTECANVLNNNKEAFPFYDKKFANAYLWVCEEDDPTTLFYWLDGIFPLLYVEIKTNKLKIIFMDSDEKNIISNTGHSLESLIQMYQMDSYSDWQKIKNAFIDGFNAEKTIENGNEYYYAEIK